MTVPMPSFDERKVVDHIAAQVASVLGRMNAGYSHARLGELLGECLRRGDWNVTVNAIEAAERGGDRLADEVLRRTFAEMSNCHEPMSHQLQAFGERAVLRPPVTRGRGRDQYGSWSRNVGVCSLIITTCLEFGVRATMTGSLRHDRRPSGCSLVRMALAKNGVHIEEKTQTKFGAAFVGHWSGPLLGKLFNKFKRFCTPLNPAICGGTTAHDRRSKMIVRGLRVLMGP